MPLGMDAKLKKILDADLKHLQQEISDPELLVPHLHQLIDTDKCRIRTEAKTNSSIHAIHELISRVKMRGPDAFPEFVQVLYEHGFKDSAVRLREKAEAAGFSICLHLGNAQVVSRGIAQPSNPSLSDPIPEEQREAISKSSKESTLTSELEKDTALVTQETASSVLSPPSDKKSKEALSKDTLLKDIPSKLKSKIVTKLQGVDPLPQSGWRGLAGECDFTVEQEKDLLSGEKPMEKLFDWMVYNNYSLSDLIVKLDKMERADIVSDIESYFESTGASSIENNEFQIQGSFSSPSPCEPSTSKDPEESDESKKHKLSQQESTERNDDQEKMMSASSELPDEVFLQAIRRGKALLLSVERYENLQIFARLQKLYELRSVLDYHGWDVLIRRNVDRSSLIKGLIEEYIKSIQKDDACFIYLAGHIVQINAENYLLPSEVDLNNTTAADIMDLSLNINAFLKEIAEQRQPLVTLVFVDGGFDIFHNGTGQCTVGNVLTTVGVAPIAPLPNTAIAFPCNPGVIRQMEDQRAFMEAIKDIVQNEEREPRNLTAAAMFSDLKTRHQTATLFALSPKTVLPFYIYFDSDGQTGPKLLDDLDNHVPRHALVFFDDTCENERINSACGHLHLSLRQLEWDVEVHQKSECDVNIRDKVRDEVRRLGDDDVKVVMIYFIGFTARDQHSLDVGTQPPINIKWVTNLMCEFINGPKLVIVGDSTQVVNPSETLAVFEPIPADVLISLPTAKPDDTEFPVIDSFTISLAQNLSEHRNKSLRNIITTTRERWRYQIVSTNLFYA